MYGLQNIGLADAVVTGGSAPPHIPVSLPDQYRYFSDEDLQKLFFQLEICSTSALPLSSAVLATVDDGIAVQ